MRPLFVLLAVLWGLPLQASERIAGETRAGGAEINLVAPISVMPDGGFFPLRVEMFNQGKKEAKYQINCECSIRTPYRMSAEGGSIRSRFSVSCPAGEVRVVDLLIPVHTRSSHSGGDRSLSFECQADTGERVRTFRGYFDKEGTEFCFGMSDKLLTRYASDLEGVFSSYSRSGYYPGSSPSVFGGIDVEKLPDDWRAYAGYDAIALTKGDFLALSPGVKLALDQWVRSGGHLLLLSDTKTPVPGFDGAADAGLGNLSRLFCGENYDSFNSSSFAGLVRKQRTSLEQMVSGDYGAYGWQVGQEMGSRKVQKGLLLLTLIIFAIVVGPVNLFFWAGRNRRHRLFVTTPLISLVASLLLVGFIVLRDGFGGEGARAILIEVGGPDDKSAVILQEQFSRCGILLSSSFELDDETVFFPARPPKSDLSPSDSTVALGNYNLEVSKTKEGWEYSGDLFQSRGEQVQALRSVVPSRERLELAGDEPGAPRLTSSFSYTLTKVFYTDGGGKVWEGGSMSPGETISLVASDTKQQWNEIGNAVYRFGATNQKSVTRLLARPKSFVAVSGEAPAIPTHSSIDWSGSPILITGLLSR